MSRVPEPDTEPCHSARPKEAGGESGADDVESRSGRTRNPTPSGARRRIEAGKPKANRALLSPSGTAAARKIDNGGAECGGSSAEAEVTGGQVESEADCEEVERVERRRAWARELVKSFPPWSEQQFREASAALGYRLKERE